MIDDSDEELIFNPKGNEIYIAAASAISVQLQSSKASLLLVSDDSRQESLLYNA